MSRKHLSRHKRHVAGVAPNAAAEAMAASLAATGDPKKQAEAARILAVAASGKLGTGYPKRLPDGVTLVWDDSGARVPPYQPSAEELVYWAKHTAGTDVPGVAAYLTDDKGLLADLKRETEVVTAGATDFLAPIGRKLAGAAMNAWRDPATYLGVGASALVRFIPGVRDLFLVPTALAALYEGAKALLGPDPGKEAPK